MALKPWHWSWNIPCCMRNSLAILTCRSLFCCQKVSSTNLEQIFQNVVTYDSSNCHALKRHSHIQFWIVVTSLSDECYCFSLREEPEFGAMNETHIHIHLHVHLHTHARIHIGICCQNGAESPAPQAAACQLWAGEANHFPGLPSQGLSPNNLRQHVHWKTALERWLRLCMYRAICPLNTFASWCTNMCSLIVSTQIYS